MTSGNKGNTSVDATFIEEIQEQIQQLQNILISIATGGPRIEDKEAEYGDLYKQIDAKLRYLRSSGVAVRNPNSFRSLWDWHGYYSLNLPRYQNRRDYIRHLYDGILIPIQEVLSTDAKDSDEGSDLFQSLKVAVYQQTIQSTSHVPTEIRDSLEHFQTDYPDPLKAAFIMMKFGTSKVHSDITAAIRSALLPHGIQGLRADDKHYSDDLFPNVMTYMRGCGFGIAVFERIETNEFNPNVSLEVGYMLALGKPVCLLKDKTLTGLQTDLVGKLYSLFDTYEITNTINIELSKWLLGKGIVM